MCCRFVGQSEENIRNLFADAEADLAANGEGADLHVIIFDEIDAICKQRTGSSQPGSHDTIVNQLLTKIDGVSRARLHSRADTCVLCRLTRLTTFW